MSTIRKIFVLEYANILICRSEFELAICNWQVANQNLTFTTLFITEPL